MVDNSVSTLAPNRPIQDVLESSPAQASSSTLSYEKKALFDSIAHDESTAVTEQGPAPLRAFFAGLLWFGYAVAIVVALVLVWSAANGLLRSVPQ